MSDRIDHIRKAAQEIYRSEDVDVHEDAPVMWDAQHPVSDGGGAWVQAWVYVSDEVVHSTREKT